MKGRYATAEKLWPHYVICRESGGSKNLGGQAVIEVFLMKQVGGQLPPCPPKGQITSEQICGVLKFSKKATKYCQDFCPSL